MSTEPGEDGEEELSEGLRASGVDRGSSPIPEGIGPDLRRDYVPDSAKEKPQRGSSKWKLARRLSM